MSARVALTHRIERRFAAPVRLGPLWLRLRPVPAVAERVRSHALRVETEPHFVNWVRDAYGNHVARLDLPEPVTQLGLVAALLVDTGEHDPFGFLVDASASEHPFAYGPALEKELAPYRGRSTAPPEVERWIASLDRTPRYVVDRLVELTATMRAAVSGTAAELAWGLTLALRALGLAGRVCGGYRLVCEPGAVSAGLHAWSEVFLPGAGWIGLDPSAGILVTDAYVPLARAPELRGIAVTAGMEEASPASVRQTIAARLLEPQPPAWPYDDAQWGAIATLGRRVSVDLAAARIGLTVARELAFAPLAHADAPEWSTRAAGEEQRAAGAALVRALGARIVPGGAVQATSGPWYAGERAPRWRLACVGREDGQPVWREASLLAAGGAAAPDDPPPAAETFGKMIARALDLPLSALVAAYEDPLSRLGRDGSAVIAAPAPEVLDDPMRRRALADRLSEELAGTPAGWVLPLAHDGAGWLSPSWTFRRSRLYLTAGTLPLGLRLPLDGLPAGALAAPNVWERSPLAPTGSLPDARAAVAERLARRRQPAPSTAEAATRAALCIETRGGRLHVFLPPLACAEHWLELVAAVEAAAEAVGTPVVLEGYEPPEDHRLRRLCVEPDAGVLRVALPPSSAWLDHTAVLDAAYATADGLGLGAMRRLADGSGEPLGSAVALVLGGPAPAASPWLRRPELLRALVVYWQRHPSLSYLFATHFVGPWSPAPRVDEGRDDALYELSLALERIPDGECEQAWLGDRLLRHLLADASGDVRRAELCMADLYDPDRTAGRLGRLAWRGLEAPPAARLAALESLLVCALVARFAFDPWGGTLEPWGTALHDRLLLPSALWDDLRAVLRDLGGSGHVFEADWFRPFFELRFPVLGRLQVGDLALELRRAHEPWPVLAEQSTAAGPVRLVDSANERLEVRASGLAPGRWVLACNGRRVPLRPVGADGEWVAGVRYKVWNPPSTVHPTRWAVGTLVFDLIDTWTDRAVAGCTYVPARPSFVGIPVGVRPAARTWGDGAQPPERMAAPLMVWRRSGAGRFVREGSGVGRTTVPPDDAGGGYLLDLTVTA